MSEAALAEMRCDIIDELHDEIEVLRWQRMVLVATAFQWRGDALRRRDSAHSYCNMDAAFAALGGCTKQDSGTGAK